jgi:hypothetical protein
MRPPCSFLLNQPLFKGLQSLRLDVANFTIAGSGPLYARGWIDDPTDLDVVARDVAWSRAASLGVVEDAPHGEAKRVQLFSGHIEVLNAWFPEIWTVDELINYSDVLCGIRFVSLDVVIRSKQLTNRPRDREHLTLIAEQIRCKRE